MIIDPVNQVILNLSDGPIRKEEMALALHQIGAVQFGSFKLKSGIISPIYVDVRKTFTYPQILRKLLELMWQQISGKPYDLICGVPLSALVFASYISLEKLQPMVVCRPEKKEHGAGRRIEGDYFAGQQCLIIEDVITSGASILETVETLKGEGLLVSDAVCLIDREQGGVERLRKMGIHVHTVFKLTEILEILERKGKLSAEKHLEALSFLESVKVSS